MSMIDAARTLDTEEAMRLLAKGSFGRLAFAIAGEPDIVPINYCVDDGKVYFRTAEGGKLLGVTVNNRVALEADHVDDGTAVSVVVHGTARELLTTEEVEHVESLPLRPWVSGEKNHFVEITPIEATGRRFRLDGHG